MGAARRVRVPAETGRRDLAEGKHSKRRRKTLRERNLLESNADRPTLRRSVVSRREARLDSIPDQPFDVSIDTSEPTFLRIKAVRVTSLGRSTIYRLIAGEMFPCPMRFGPRTVAWRRPDLERWSSTRLATRN